MARALTVALLACAVVVLLFTKDRGGRTTSPGGVDAARSVRSPQSRPVISSPQPPQIANFPVLRGPPEGLPAATKRILRTPEFGVNWALAQRLAVAVPGEFWAIPGNGFLCVVAQLDVHSTARSCATTGDALTHGLAAVMVSDGPRSGPGPGSRLIVGIAPDGARRALVNTAGTVASAPVSNNVFVLHDSATGPPDSVTLQ